MTIWEELTALAARKRAEAAEAAEAEELEKMSFPAMSEPNGEEKQPDEDGADSATAWIDGQKKVCEKFNRTTRGSLTGIDCPECLNRGYSFQVDESGRRYSVECSCMAARRNLWRIAASGLSDLVERYTFDSWKTPEPWQKMLLDRAKQYAERPDGWFAVCGSTGTGKSHICTAICGELMRRGMDVRYMLWRDIGTKLKASVTDPELYQTLIQPLKTARVLYIDDLFKTGKGTSPTTADVNLAFEILNSRYNSSGLYTIISTEMSVDELMDTDEAVGGRIYERTKRNGNCINLAGKRNWRRN